MFTKFKKSIGNVLYMYKETSKKQSRSFQKLSAILSPTHLPVVQRSHHSQTQQTSPHSAPRTPHNP